MHHKTALSGATLAVVLAMFLALALLAHGPAMAQGTAAPAATPAEGAEPAEGAGAEALTTPSAPVPPPQAAAPNESALDLLLRERANDLLGLADEANKMIESARSLAPAYNEALQEADTSLSSLLRLYQISKGHPMEQDDILRQLNGLRSLLQRNMSPLEDIASTISQRQAELSAMDQTARQQAPAAATPAPKGTGKAPAPAQGAGAGQEAPESPDAQPPQGALDESYANNLQLATTHLSQASVGIETLLAPGKALLKRLDEAIAQIQADLPATWHDYYFTESRVFSSKLPSMVLGSTSIFKWLSQLANRALFIYPQTGGDWAQSLANFLMTGAIVFFIGFFLQRAAHRLPHNWEYSIQKIFRGPWLYFTLGMALTNAAKTSLGGTYLIFAFPGILVLIWGIAGLSWFLRVAAKPSLLGNISPLTRFFVPAALGVTLLFADVPTAATSILWFIVMALFILKLRSIRRKNKDANLLAKTFPLERFAYGSAFYFSLISLIFAVVGFPRIAILVFMLLFALVNVLILGDALMHLGTVLSQYVFDQETDPIKYAILNAVVVPLAYVLALLSALPWLRAVPGSNYLIQNYLHMGYSVGAASFDLTKILFIVALFFLFRSLRTLGTTSLKHLPERLPLEPGVIPPLQMLLTYLIWIIFALIALMLLGVNFTSLAVIAGGLSVGIGFGLQNIFSNLVSGIMLIFGRTILVGDYIEVGGIAGTVRSVSIRCTVVETASNAAVFVPNSSIMSNQFINWTRNGRHTRRSITAGIPYGTDTKAVVALLLEAAKGDPRIMADPAPGVTLNEFADNYLQFILYVTIVDIDLVAGVLSDLRLRAESLFKENGIRFFSPSLDVRLDPKGLKALPQADAGSSDTKAAGGDTSEEPAKS
ncbi:MAG: mechanosensitive ion channel [Deltaproteobacteria bacterium]|jgi:small-conductance mechanosensitive channel|nr:mechanosensitive ion channel [Deltaproteobacteria bacterium]